MAIVAQVVDAILDSINNAAPLDAPEPWIISVQINVGATIVPESGLEAQFVGEVVRNQTTITSCRIRTWRPRTYRPFHHFLFE